MQRLLSLLILLASIGCGWSSPAPHPHAHVFDSTIPLRVHLSYLVFVRASYATTPETHWLLILYLHGGLCAVAMWSGYALCDRRIDWKASQIFRSWSSRRSVLWARSG